MYKIPSDVGDGVNRAWTIFRSKKLFDFGFSDPSQLGITNNGQFTYTKSGDK